MQPDPFRPTNEDEVLELVLQSSNSFQPAVLFPFRSDQSTMSLHCIGVGMQVACRFRPHLLFRFSPSAQFPKQPLATFASHQ